MRTTATPPVRTRASDRQLLALRLIAVAGLCVNALIHLDLATGPLYADGEVTMAGLFVADAVAALAVAVWLVVRGGPPALLGAAVVALGSLGALVVAAYVQVPALGPLPSMYEPFWYAEKVVAAVSAGAAAVAALLGAAVLRRRAAAG